MGPVFLFDVGVVIFMIGPASGELDGRFSFGKVPLEVIIEELASIVAIEAEEGEREAFFNEFDLLQDGGFSLSPDGPLFGPTGGDIEQIDGIDVDSGCGIATMSHGIGFKEAGARFVPLVGFDGDLLS